MSKDPEEIRKAAARKAVNQGLMDPTTIGLLQGSGAAAKKQREHILKAPSHTSEEQHGNGGTDTDTTNSTEDTGTTNTPNNEANGNDGEQKRSA